jgi:hypothetical protein
MSIRRRLSCFLAGGALSAALLVSGAQGVAAADGSCAGGPIAAGTYPSLTISGFCLVVAGDVNVTGNVSVTSGGVLFAAFAGSTLSIGQNLLVGAGGIAVLGCEPEAFPCFNGPGITNDTVSGNVVGDGALMMLLHHNKIGGGLVQSAGGGGVNCSTFPFGPPPNGPPAYSTYEDNVINGNANIQGLRTCWAGFIRNTVGGNVNYDNNVTFDEDGNEVVTDTIAGTLNCVANDPAVQFGDSGGIPSTVGGQVHGQCTAVA